MRHNILLVAGAAALAGVLLPRAGTAQPTGELPPEDRPLPSGQHSAARGPGGGPRHPHPLLSSRPENRQPEDRPRPGSRPAAHPARCAVALLQGGVAGGLVGFATASVINVPASLFAGPGTEQRTVRQFSIGGAFVGLIVAAHTDACAPK